MINVIGLGYIGLPTALMFAKSGVPVVGTDLNEELVGSLSKGKLAFEEEGLGELFQNAKDNGIEFTTDYQESDTYIISVPTPYIPSTKKLDSKYVMKAVEKVLDVCHKGSILIIESTISPGTIDKNIRLEIEKRDFVIGEDVHLVHAPERIIPGNMVYELEYNSRTIGVDNADIGKQVKDLYANFCNSEIIVTDIRSAEMSKVVENTYRDINIAFANELAKICREDNMDIYEIIRIANKHPRVNVLQPGPGVGGHCISVDPWFLVGDYPETTKLISAARYVNNSMPEHVLTRIRDIMKENKMFDTSKIGIYGLAYKEDVNDTRESPALQLLEKMDEQLVLGVKSFDPFINEKIVENQETDFNEFLDGIEILIISTAHSHIKENLEMISDKLILDTKNICPAERAYKL
ncbi:nucleotide sugar dehydrogenase [Tetragenococcus halophilus]|uniref:nucleotide sugar dehydrogenase n=1 Tax=Tetragenococcus halophilus TaxID=51669 RepID=UPI00209AFE4E|nr:nucleotide sugar dehydrogenase [Tetragenococcus halophilus]MCO8291376.1 nucleotide sugar dehydrogenase [Tetragenococcus halophilus]